jgi:signal transduction histidine kinase
MVLSIWVNFSILARFITLVMLLSSLVVFSTAIVILSRGHEPAQLFIIVQAILFPSIVIRALGMFSILPIMLGQISIFITISILMPLLMMLYNRRMNFLAHEKEAALAQAMKTEQMMVQELEKQVLERTHKLKVAQTRAEEANLAKGEFLAVMSHVLFWISPHKCPVGLDQNILGNPKQA